MQCSPDQQFIALQEVLAGRFSLQEEIGRGGMGVVYLAHDVSLDRPVALKLLPRALSSHLEFRERFLREARTAAKLSHPNIIPIFSVDEVGEFVYFVMAYVQGETLGQQVRRRGPLPASEGARILKEVAWALSYAHSQGVIHRDVKPDNILLEEGTNRALVADFGIAGVVEETGAAGMGEIIGTAEFMSPEQASGSGVDARSDIYSMGVLGFYVLSGSLPFQAESVMEVLRQHREDAPPPLSTVGSAIPSRLARSIDRCLAKDPTARFDSATAFAEAMDATLLQRREVPVPVRNFLNDPVDLPGDGPLYYLTTAVFLFAIFMLSRGLNVYEPFFIAAGLMLPPPILLAVPRIRRLLKAGHNQRDLEAGIKVALERRREEVAHAFGVTPPRTELAAFSVSRVAGGVLVGSVVGFITGVLTGLEPLFDVYGSAGLAAVGLGILSRGTGLLTKARRVDLKAERRYKFWKSRFAKWLFKLSGIGIKRTALPTGLTHRPTELQIGFAADGLYESLPKAVRRNLGDVPSILRRLESDAQTLRQTIKTLDDAQASARIAEQSVPADIAAAREHAEHQLTEAVASLEAVRLGLLRLTMGSGTVESLTTDLAAASEVGNNIDRLMAGMADVNTLLRST